MKIAVLGPGGVGGLIAGVLGRAGTEVTILARESTVAEIERHGVDVRSVIFGDFIVQVPAVAELREPADALIIATKAAGLQAALERVALVPPLVLPLLNGLDHLAVLRERFPSSTVLAASIRVEADRPEPGHVVHTSPFLLISMATADHVARSAMQALADELARAEIPIQVLDCEAQVMWSKLVRLNALACTTSAHDVLLGEIRSTPELRAELVGAIEEACAVGQAEGAADVDAAKAIAELDAAHDTLGSSMQRDIAAGREPELDAIAGSVLRAAARHGIPCPTIEALVAIIAARAGVPMPMPMPDASGSP